MWYNIITKGKEVKTMTNLEAFVAGALIVITIWLVTSAIQERGHGRLIKAKVSRAIQLIKTAWKGSK